MSLMDRCPSIEDLRRRARRRLPNVAWEYLDSGTGPEEALARNRRAMQAVTLTPRFFRDATQPDLSTEILGLRYAAPFGVAPIGLQSMMWPGAELALARAAVKAGIPYALSTVAGESLEAVSKATDGRFWFQLYTPVEREMRADLLARAAAARAQALVVTVDIPAPSRRERQRRAGVAMPPRMTPAMIANLLMHPAWLSATLSRGLPRFRTMERYASPAELASIAQFIGKRLTMAVSAETFAGIRAAWDGKLIVKGLMHPDDAREALDLGADAIWVSNHGARQLDLAPAAIDALPAMVEAVAGRAPVIFDSGVRNGGDIARALALGADFVFLGRPFVWGMAALGRPGAAHAMEILREELVSVHAQLGCQRPADLREHLA